MEHEDSYSLQLYSKSATRSFQAELKAAVNERAVRHGAPHSNNYSSDDDDDDDDDDNDGVLNELLKTRRQKMDDFKASRTKTSINDFNLSDKEEENIRPKHVSFLKTQRNSDTLRLDTLRSDAPRLNRLRSDRASTSHHILTKALSQGKGQQDSGFISHSDSPTLQNSTALPSAVKMYRSESSPCSSSQLESLVPLYSENNQWESSIERVSEATPPISIPHQQASHLVSSAADERDAQILSNRAATPAIANTCTSKSTCTSPSSQYTGDSWSDAPQVGVSVKVKTDSRPLEGGKSSASGSLLLESPVADSTVSRSSRCTSSSRYLGTLKVLEQRFQETSLDTADSLRAVVYQEWLKKKEEKLQAIFKSKEEERLKEEKKREEETSKKAEAEASYEAWKQKKQEILTEKIRAKHEVMRQLQKEIKEKEERKQNAKQVFEKWKQEHDDVLRKQHQKHVQTKNRLREKKEKEKEQRTQESRSSFAQWNMRKTELMEEKLKSARRKKEIKDIEEKYEKEERERTALEMYNDWLKGKEFQQNRERREKNMRTIVEEPPPWSPPSRTVPFQKRTAHTPPPSRTVPFRK